MMSAEEFVCKIAQHIRNDADDELAIKSVEKRDLENRIAGLREAASIALGPASVIDPRVQRILNKADELERELKP